MNMLRLGGAAIITALAGIAMATLASPASAAVPGLERVSASSVTDLTAFKSVTVACPPGKQVVGAEYSISGGIGSIVLDDLVPSQTTVRVGARADANGTTSSWSVRATAMCANPLPGYEIVSASSAVNSASKSAIASCPAGKQLVGSGAFLNGGLGEVVIDALIPSTSSVTATAFEGDNGGTANNWSITARAICANPLPGRQVVFATSASSSAAKAQDVVCPAGTQVLSAGFDIFGAPGEVTVIGMFTSLFDRTASMGALEDDNGTTASWTARAFGICATP
jgi:hypothetical protein